MATIPDIDDAEIYVSGEAPKCPECRNEMTRCVYGERWGEPYHCHICNWPGR